MTWILVGGFFGATAVTLTSKCGCSLCNNALVELNDCFEGLLRLGSNIITFRA